MSDTALLNKAHHFGLVAQGHFLKVSLITAKFWIWEIVAAKRQ